MAYSIGFEDDLSAILVTVRDRITMREFKAAMQEMFEAQRAQGAVRVLWDFRDASLVELRAEHVRELSGYQSLARVDLPRSLVALLTANELDFGIARMLCGHASTADVECRAFRDDGLARDWLRQSAP